MRCFLHPDLKLDRLVIVCKFDNISSQRRGSEINMDFIVVLKPESVFLIIAIQNIAMDVYFTLVVTDDQFGIAVPLFKPHSSHIQTYIT